jgi:hypothetical protein
MEATVRGRSSPAGGDAPLLTAEPLTSPTGVVQTPASSVVRGKGGTAVALDFYATAGAVRSRTLVVDCPAGGTVSVDVVVDGLRFLPIAEFSVGATPDPASLVQQSESQIDARFGAGMSSSGGYDKSTYTVSLPSGGIHHAQMVVWVEEGGEPVRKALSVLVFAVASVAPASSDAEPIDPLVGGTFVRVLFEIPQPFGTFTLARLDVFDPSGTRIVSEGVILDPNPADSQVGLFYGGPPLRPGHEYSLSISFYDPTGEGLQVLTNWRFVLLQRKVTVRLTELLLHSDLDAMGAGDFRLHARLIGRTRSPWRDHEFAYLASTAEFKLDDHDPGHLVGDKWYQLPVPPDTRDFTLVDGPAMVEEDRDEVWVRIVASESDATGTERAGGLVRLFVPNTNESTASLFESRFDEPIENWDWDDPRPPSPPTPKNSPRGSGILTREDGDPVLTVYGTYSIEYVEYIKLP